MAEKRIEDYPNTTRPNAIDDRIEAIARHYLGGSCTNENVRALQNEPFLRELAAAPWPPVFSS